MHARHGDVGWFLALVKLQDAAVGQAQGVLQVGRGVGPGGLQFAGRDAQRIGPYAIEAFAQLQQGGITTGAHLLEDHLHPLGRLLALAAAGALSDRLQPLAGRLRIAQHRDLHRLVRRELIGGAPGLVGAGQRAAGGHGHGSQGRGFKLDGRRPATLRRGGVRCRG